MPASILSRDARQKGGWHLKYLHFAVFYFVQGAIQSYLSNFQKPYLVGAGVTLDQIAWLSAIMLFPFWIKIVFGWVSDRYRLFGDHRKSYMTLGLMLAAASYLGVAFLDPSTQFTQFSTLIFVSAVGMAMFDTCADGLAVDVARPDEEGPLQSAMMFGRGVGYILLAFVLGQLAMRAGYQAVFITLFAIIAVVLGFVLWRCPQVKSTTQKRLSSWGLWSEYWREHKRGFIYLAIFSVVYSVPSFGIDGLTTLFGKMKLGLSDDVLGQMGSLQGVGTIVGALACALVLRMLGMVRTSYLAVILLSVGGWLVTWMHDYSSALLLSFVWGTAWAFQETFVLALCMRVAKGSLAATAFALLMMCSNIGSSLGELAGVKMVDTLGLTPTFQWLALGNLLLLPFLWRKWRQAPF